MRTWITPDDVDAILANVSRLRSMMRPATKGPRSATRQVVDAPVASLITVTMVPKGSERWAQVPAGASYHEAPPVWLFRGAAVVSVVEGGEVAWGGVVVVVVGGGLEAALNVAAVVVVVGGAVVGGTAAWAAAPLSVGVASGAGTDCGSLTPASGPGQGLGGTGGAGADGGVWPRSTITAAPTAAMCMSALPGRDELMPASRSAAALAPTPASCAGLDALFRVRKYGTSKAVAQRFNTTRRRIPTGLSLRGYPFG
jgi:hypothetical protein